MRAAYSATAASAASADGERSGSLGRPATTQNESEDASAPDGKRIKEKVRIKRPAKPTLQQLRQLSTEPGTKVCH